MNSDDMRNILDAIQIIQQTVPIHVEKFWVGLTNGETAVIEWDPDSAQFEVVGW